MRWKYVGALALPFVIGATGLRLAIAPGGDAIAGAVARTSLTSDASAANERTAGDHGGAGEVAIGDAPALRDAPGGARGAAPAARAARIAARGTPAQRATLDEARDAGGDAARAPSPPALTDAPKATIVVAAAAVARALEKRDVGATNATAPDGSPLGARLSGVSRYHTGLRDGDVVVSVGGTRTPTVDAMVGAAMAVASAGATRVSGRIVRGDALYAVVIELPK
jgi:hypothetical protein